MKKFGLFSLILAIFLVLATVLVACNNDVVSTHDHVWDGGTVTTRPTCHSEGLRTYACTVKGCTQTKTEPIGMTQHNWNDGEITEPSTCQSMGTKTYACQNDGCTATKTEKLQKSAHNWDEGVLTQIPDFYTPGSKKYTCLTEGCGETRTESVRAHADFAEQYYLSVTEANNWAYGYVEDFDPTSFNFEQIFEIDGQSNAWNAGGAEISKGRVAFEDTAAVAYTFKEVVKAGMQVEIYISYVGDEGAPAVKAYLYVTHAGVTTRTDLNQDNAKDWTYTSEEAYDLAQGDGFAVVFSKDDASKASGAFTFTLTAPCNHVWGNATVKDAATCTLPGTMQYTCLNDCGATMDEDIPATGHNWDNGEVTQEPTATEDGVKTFHCLNGCGETKTENIPKLAPFESANLVEDFNDVLSGANEAWKIGVVDYKSDADFTFTALTTKDEYAFTNGAPWIEFKSGWAAINGVVGVAYTFGAGAQQVDLDFSLTANSGAVFAVRWAVKNENGEIVSGGGNASWGGKTSDNGGTVTINQTLDFNARDTIYILITRENESTSDQCTYTYTLTKHTDGPDVPPTTEGTIVNFNDEFEATLAGANNGWSVGNVTYTFDPEAFEYFKTDRKNTGSDAFINVDGKPFFEMKGNWAAIGEWAAIAYAFKGTGNVHFKFALTGVGEATFSVRYAVMSASGTAKTGPEFAGNAAQVTAEADITVEAGDTLYIIIKHESGGDAANQCTYTYTVTKYFDEPGEPVEPAEPFEGANLADDFGAMLAGEGNGWSFGNVDFDFGTGTFVYHKTDRKNGGNDGFINVDGKTFFEMKGNWAAIGNMAAIAYTFGADAKVVLNFSITASGAADFSVRWAVKNASDAIVSNSGQVSWGGKTSENDGTVTINETIEFHAGETLYIIINHESGGDAANQCTYTCRLTKGAEAFAKFADDFDLESTGRFNNWEIGYATYHWGEDPNPETFEFTKVTEKNDAGDAYKNGDPFVEVKGDWAAVGGMLAIAYHFDRAQTVDIDFLLNRAEGNSDGVFSVRWAVKNSSGEIVGNDGKASWGGTNETDGSFALHQQITVNSGDTLYILINHDRGGDQCTFSLELSAEA